MTIIVQYRKHDGAYDYLQVHPDTMGMGMYRTLTADEESEFRVAAMRESRGVKVNPLWHPVYQDQLIVSGQGVV